MTLLATTDELRIYLAEATIDTDRATLMLQLAQDSCETIVKPLPATAKSVVLAVAARAFDNPTATSQEQVGNYSARRPGGLWLTRADKSSLRRLAGGGGAFGIDTLPTGISAVQTLACTATGGTFRLNFGGQYTAAIAYNASAAAVQTALAAVGLIGSGNVAVTGSWVVSFVNSLATTPVPTFTVDASALTGGDVIVTVTRAGAYKPGQNLPSWDYDYRGQRPGILGNGTL